MQFTKTESPSEEWEGASRDWEGAKTSSIDHPLVLPLTHTLPHLWSFTEDTEFADCLSNS